MARALRSRQAAIDDASDLHEHMFALRSLQLYRQLVAKKTANEAFEGGQVLSPSTRVEGNAREAEVSRDALDERARFAHEHVFAET
jgi:hypothetical protein